MNKTITPWNAALVLVALLALVGAAAARIITPEDQTEAARSDRYTVVLADGWELADVAVTWYADEGVLVAERADGARRTLRPEDLAGLRDQTGRDVTAEILPRWACDRLGGELPPAAPQPAPQPTPEPSPQPPVQVTEPQPSPRAWRDFEAPRECRAVQPNLDPRVIFSLGMGYSVPQDGHYGGYNGGLGFEGVLRLQLAGPIYLSGGYLYQTLQNPGYLVMGWECPPDGNDCLDYPYISYSDEEGRLFGPWAGLSLVSTAESEHPVRFYLEGGVGRFDVDGLPLWNYEDAYVGYRLATGFMIPVGDMAAFNLGCRALHMPTLDFGWDPDNGHTMLGVEAGLSIFGF